MKLPQLWDDSQYMKIFDHRMARYVNWA